MAYREVTMIEVKEVLRLWFAGTATKRIAAMLGLDPKTVRRYLSVAAGGRGRAGARRGDRGPGHDGVAGAASAERSDRAGMPGRCARPSGSRLKAWLGERLAADQDPQAARPPRRRRALRHVASVCRRRVGIRPAAPPRWRSSMGSPARRCSWTPAGWAGCASAGHTPAVSRVDLHRRAIASSLRLPRLPGDDGHGHRGVRGGLGVLRGHLPRPHPR